MDLVNSLLLSIIIPVYNTELYLKDCLDSCLCQDLLKEQYEIICINDGSTDSSAQILESYHINYPNIRVINQENSGVSSARNSGLQSAKGKYIWFVDSDDFIKNDCVLTLINILESQKLDAITIKNVNINQYECFRKINAKVLHKIDKSELTLIQVWRWIVKSEILHKNKIIFDTNLYYAEDTLWTYYLNRNIKKCLHTDYLAYYYRKRSNSQMSLRNHEANNKKINSMINIASIYKNEVYNISDDIVLLEETKIRQNLSVQAALWYAALTETRAQQKNIFNRLIENKLYPYDFFWPNLKPKVNVKKTLIDASQFLFPIRIYYSFFCALVALIKRTKLLFR